MKGSLLAVFATLLVLLLGACDDTSSPNSPKSGASDSVLPVDTPQVTHSDTPGLPPALGNILEDYENPQRENWQKPQLVLANLGELSDKIVADIGAGTGYFSFRIAEKAEKVIAIDIQQEFLDFIDQKLETLKRNHSLNIETRLTAPDDPSIHPQEADIILIVNTYHLIENRTEYFRKVRSGLKDEGKLVVIDFKKVPSPIGPPIEARLAHQEIQSELQEAGFTRFDIDTLSLEYQFLISAR